MCCDRHRKAVVWLSVLLGVASRAQAEAPRVTQSVPAPHATEVAPMTREIRVTFDQPMDRAHGYSIVGGGPEFPQIIGKPRWANDRTIVISVRLEPEHEYWLSINSDRFSNFRNQMGEAATPYPISFTTGRDRTKKSATLAPAENREALEILKWAIDQEYSFRDRRHVDWDKVFSECAPELESARTPLQFARIAAKVFEPADDIHISLIAQGQVFYPWKGQLPPANFNYTTLKRIVPDWNDESELVSSGRFSDGIQYVLIRLWDAGKPQDLEPAYGLIGGSGASKRLIIDVRPNGGGDEAMARRFAGCFIDSPKVYAKNQNRADGKFYGPFTRVVEPNPDRPHFKGRIAVLMGPRCVSSNESFLLMMKQVADCKLIGGRSRGASGNPRPIELGNGVRVFLPSWRDMLPDGTCFEGQGLGPDVEVPSTPADFDSGDPVLAAALKWLRP